MRQENLTFITNRYRENIGDKTERANIKKIDIVKQMKDTERGLKV